MQELAREVKEHLCTRIIPFWEKLRDDEYGGYYGYLDYALQLDKKAEKGCILNSRIIWFFANACTVLGEKELLGYARHGFEFMKDHCIDKEYGGVFWSLDYEGNPKDTTKHTYNQAFSIYALSSYYEASGEAEALQMAKELFHLIETKCRDEKGYLESFNRSFEPEENDKLSENGVIADRTMNTLLHVFEAYTELYRNFSTTEPIPASKAPVLVVTPKNPPINNTNNAMSIASFNPFIGAITKSENLAA